MLISPNQEFNTIPIIPIDFCDNGSPSELLAASPTVSRGFVSFPWLEYSLQAVFRRLKPGFQHFQTNENQQALWILDQPCRAGITSPSACRKRDTPIIEQPRSGDRNSVFCRPLEQRVIRAAPGENAICDWVLLCGRSLLSPLRGFVRW